MVRRRPPSSQTCCGAARAGASFRLKGRRAQRCGKGQMGFWIGMAVFMGLIVSIAVLGGAIVGNKNRRRGE